MDDKRSTALRRLLLASSALDALLLCLVLIGAAFVIDMYGGSLAGLLWVVVFVLLALIYQLLTELFFGGWTVGKAVFGLRASMQGAPPPLSIRLYRCFYRLVGYGVFRPSKDGVPAHDHMLGIGYETPILASAPVLERDWRITVLNGERRGAIFRASAARGFRRKGRITVGRDPSADIRLPDQSVSREHAVLLVGGTKAEIMDVGSTNGTRINGRPLPPHVRADCGSVARVTFGRVDVEIVRQRVS